MNARLKVYSTCLPSPLAQCASRLGDQVLRLLDEPAAILRALHSAGPLPLRSFSGPVQVCDRADFRQLRLGNEAMGYLPTAQGMLHLQVQRWRTVLAVLAACDDCQPRSLQFFDGAGQRQLEVPMQGPGFAFEDLTCALLHPEQHSLSLPMPFPVVLPARVDVDALERDWCAARDDACFRALLKSHRLSRLQALRHLRRGYALALQPASVPTLMAALAAQHESVELSVPQGLGWHLLRGRLVPSSGNAFRCGDALISCRWQTITEAWRVRTCTGSAIETRIELYDDAGNICLQIGCPDSPQRWQRLLCETLAACD